MEAWDSAQLGSERYIFMSPIRRDEDMMIFDVDLGKHEVCAILFL